MISEPIRYLDRFIDAGCDIISVHAEVCTEKVFQEILHRLEAKGVKAGISVNPDTEVPDWVIRNLTSLYLVNLMSVQPGFSGQKFMPEVLPKMRMVSQFIRDQGVDTVIEADGGIDASNVFNVVAAGARMLVAGSAVCGQQDVRKAIAELKKKALPAIKEV
jgi:transketolase